MSLESFETERDALEKEALLPNAREVELLQIDQVLEIDYSDHIGGHWRINSDSELTKKTQPDATSSEELIKLHYHQRSLH